MGWVPWRTREAVKQAAMPVAIRLDTSGPEIRAGFVKDGGMISLVAGEELKLDTDYSFKGDATCIAQSYDKLRSSAKEGNTILCADGSLSSTRRASR